MIQSYRVFSNFLFYIFLVENLNQSYFLLGVLLIALDADYLFSPDLLYCSRIVTYSYVRVIFPGTVHQNLADYKKHFNIKKKTASMQMMEFIHKPGLRSTQKPVHTYSICENELPIIPYNKVYSKYSQHKKNTFFDQTGPKNVYFLYINKFLSYEIA